MGGSRESPDPLQYPKNTLSLDNDLGKGRRVFNESYRTDLFIFAKYFLDTAFHSLS